MVDFWCRFFSRFGADFFTVYADFSRLLRDANGEKKHLVIDVSFSRLVFHGLPPLDLVRKRGRNANASVSGTLPFRRLSP